MPIQDVKDQYKTSENLETRMSIYQHAVNPETLGQWIARQVKPGKNLKILELGCGTGSLWEELKPSFPACDILLSDLSQGMIDKARELLGDDGFRYEIIDFHDIPHEDSSFDVVISNHNLYHADNLDKVLSEISRVLRKGGVFYGTTNSIEHLARIREMIGLEDESIWPNTILTSLFGTEEGGAVLGKYFPSVKLHPYENELRIKDFDLIERYLMSVRDERVHRLAADAAGAARERFEREVDEKGYFSIPTRAGMFECPIPRYS